MTHNALAAGELLAKAKVSKLIGDAHRTQDYAGRTHGFIYSAGELVPLAAVVIGVEGISQDVGRARLDLLVEAVNALPTLLAELTAANARVKEALEKIDAFDKNYFAPWGSWKTAWWEGEVSDDAEFCDANALKHVINIVRAALATSPKDRP